MSKEPEDRELRAGEYRNRSMITRIGGDYRWTRSGIRRGGKHESPRIKTQEEERRARRRIK